MSISDLCGTGESRPRVLVVTTAAAPAGSMSGGRAMFSHLTQHALHDILGSRLETYRVAPRPFRWTALGGVLSGKVDGVDASVVDEIAGIIRLKGVSRVWVDGSNLGYLCKKIKARSPGVEVITLFHNCEARFFLGAFLHYKSVRSFGVMVANYVAERLAVRYSDRLVCLNVRDSGLLLRLYGRGATDISAIAVRDRLIPTKSTRSPDAGEAYVLFVGGGFYANTAGIAWYAKHVAHKLPIKTLVVGMGLESVKADVERSSGVEVIGAVDDLVPYYFGASFVVAPIFDGSGMKTKVAEALMFGKRIVGTAEAFTGYENVLDRVGVSCSSPEEFIQAVKDELGREARATCPELRMIYEQNYSYAAARGRLARILGEAEPS